MKYSFSYCRNQFVAALEAKKRARHYFRSQIQVAQWPEQDGNAFPSNSQNDEFVLLGFPIASVIMLVASQSTTWSKVSQLGWLNCAKPAFKN